MFPRRLNWRVAAIVGATTSMGVGGFALAVDDTSNEAPTDDDSPNTTEVKSTDPVTLSAPVVINPQDTLEQDVRSVESVESIPSVESVEQDVPSVES